MLGEQGFLFAYDGRNPLTTAAREVADENEGDDVEIGGIAQETVEGLVVVTQTCDLVRDCRSRPYVEVAPLVRPEDERVLHEIERGQRPQFAYIHGVADQGLVADLDRIMTVEKAVVAGWRRVAGCESDKQQRTLIQALTRKRARFAFPDDFTDWVRPLQSKLRGKHDRQSDTGLALRALKEIRVQAIPSWNSQPTKISFWFIRGDEHAGVKHSNWATHLEEWLKLVPETDRFTPVDGIVATLSQMKGSDYVDSVPLDLEYLSVRSGAERSR